MRAPHILIRRLGREDLAILERVVADVFDFEVDLELSAEFLADPHHHLVVALTERRVVGFASGVHYLHPDKPAEMFVNEMSVAFEYRRRGIGRRLLEALLEHARVLGCREAWVATEPQNAAARALYSAARGKESPQRFVMVSFALDDEIARE